jgi:tetratricopeptide (TPR) repeat protein
MFGTFFYLVAVHVCFLFVNKLCYLGRNSMTVNPSGFAMEKQDAPRSIGGMLPATSPHRPVRLWPIAALALLLAGMVALGSRDARQPETGRAMEAAAGIARLYLDDGRDADAVAVCRELAERSDGRSFERLALAAALYRQGAVNEAAAEYRQLLKQDGASPVVLFNLARCLQRQQRAAEAREFFGEFVRQYGAALPALAAQADAAMRE